MAITCETSWHGGNIYALAVSVPCRSALMILSRYDHVAIVDYSGMTAEVAST